MARRAALSRRCGSSAPSPEFWSALCEIEIEGAGVELALAATERPATPTKQPSSRSGQQVKALSRRELEVAALLARGLSNRQIAEHLVLAERTMAAHIEHILNKLGFASRHQVGTWAVEHGLLR